MPVDFRDAADRHWEDAGYLFADKRLANADHLFGLSAECALKSVMQGLGMSLVNNSKPVAPYACHINILWVEFIAFAHNRGGAKYATKIDGSPNPFDDWDVNQRYAHRSIVTETKANKHQQAAETTMIILQSAILDGGVV